jgi:tRNA(Arg) A34 adenosine deaminase TadA
MTGGKAMIVTPPRMKRRRLIQAGGLAALVIGASRSVSAGTEAELAPISQPETASEEAFIKRAFKMRKLAQDKGDQPYGAVVVRDKLIIGQSWSRVILDQDPTGHAEISAIRDAAKRLNRRDLSGAILYSSSRPCPMCEAAAYWAGIARMVHGISAQDAGAPHLCG